MPDRTLAPPVADLSRLELPPYETQRLSNGIPLYVVNSGTQEVVKLEVVFHAGRPWEHKHLVARATLSQLKEGTAHHDTAAIAETFDFYGATLQTPYNLDTSSIVLYSLNKHFHKVLPLMAELLESPTFPKKELDTFIQRNQVELQVELSKTDVVAYRTITEMVFGSGHPYGYNSFPETYESLSRDDLVEHFQKHYVSENCAIFLSGRIEPGMISFIDEHLSRAIRPGSSAPPLPEATDVPPQRIHVNHPDRVQSAIRIGCRLFNRRHPEDGPVTVTWRAEYIGHVEGKFGAHPEGMKFRPPSTAEHASDNFGHWAVFWEVQNLREIPMDEIVTIQDIQSRAGTYYKPSFVPEGPVIIQNPWPANH